LGPGEYLTISHTPSVGRISMKGLRPMCWGLGDQWGGCGMWGPGVANVIKIYRILEVVGCCGDLRGMLEIWEALIPGPECDEWPLYLHGHRFPVSLFTE